MNRRDTMLALIAFGALPVATRAQAPRLSRVAIAVPIAREVPNEGITAFRQRMTEIGRSQPKQPIAPISG